MVVGVVATGVFAITFALSTTFASAMASRFLYGLANGMIPIARIMTVELLGPENAVIGIVFLPGSRAIGSIIGPVVGGLLAQPAVIHPSTYSSTGLFARYPFLLPNLAVALVAFVSLPFVLFVLPETLRVQRGGVGNGKDINVENLSPTSGINPSKLAEDDASGHEVDISSSIVLVSTEGARFPPAGGCSVNDPCSDGGAPFAGARPSDAQHRSSISSRGSGGSEDVGQEEKGSEKNGTKAPLLGGRGHRCKISNYSADEESGEDSPRHKRQPRRHAEETSRSSLYGSGGLLSPRRVRVLVLLQCLISVMDVGFFQMYPLWLLATKDSGGLQWSVSKIGKVLGWAGVGTMLFQFAGYPALVRTIGIIRLLRGSGAFCAMLFLALADVQRLASSENVSYMLGIVVVMLVGCCTSVAETAMNLASANAVPVEMRGKVGGIFAVSGSLGRAIGPAALSNLLAWSLHANPSTTAGGNNWLVDYHAVFVVEMLLMVVVLVLGRKALTLESVTVPVEHRHDVAYELVSQPSSETTAHPRSLRTCSIGSLAGTGRKVQKGQPGRV
eukprot:g10330.t1